MSKSLSTYELKRINRKKIFQLLYSSPPLTKSEISKSLGISMPTILQDIQELIDKSLVIESGSLASTGGRKATTFSINPSVKFSVGIDITNVKTSISVVDILGTVIYSSEQNLPYSPDVTFIEELGQILKAILNTLKIKKDSILGVGIAIPAIVSQDGRKINYSTVLNFNKHTIEEYESQLGFPCTFCNDSNAGGAAELWLNPQITNAFYVSINPSVGGAFLINHDIFLGKNQRCSEIGHMTIVPNGKSCYCGKKGCLDAYCNTSVLASHTHNDLGMFFQQIRRGNQDLSKIWKQYLDYLSIGINNIYLLFDCDVIIGGLMGNYMDDYIDDLQKLVAKRNPFSKDGSYVRICKYKTGAASMGAALEYIKPFLLDNFPKL